MLEYNVLSRKCLRNNAISYNLESICKDRCLSFKLQFQTITTCDCFNCLWGSVQYSSDSFL